MRVLILWDEDSHVVKLCLSKESALRHVREHNETDHVREHRHADTLTEDGRHLYDLELEAGGARYRLEEMDAD